jgi:hypothetical protein
MIDMNLKVLAPRSCLETEMDAFEALVKQGGEVQADGLGERIRAAVQLGFVNNGEMVSVAAVKRPCDEYRDKVFGDAGCSTEFTRQFGGVELGWAYTVPHLRRLGLCSLLVSMLLSHVEGAVFATCRANNAEIIGILERNRFSRLGYPYQGRTASLLLYGRSV